MHGLVCLLTDSAKIDWKVNQQICFSIGLRWQQLSLVGLAQLVTVQLTELLLSVDGIYDRTDCTVEVGQGHDLRRGERRRGGN